MEQESLQIFDNNKYVMTMSTIVKILILLIINTSFSDAQEIKQDITVSITGLDSNRGQLLVGLYNTEEHFLDKRFKSEIVEISNKTGTLVFTNIPKGTYAISFIHDENSNGKMDTNFLGIPKEDYGCSNNARGTLGPPKWKDAKFELKGQDKVITISL
ncbi:DUF2141 domain-containing protein [uncultured Winogradskyella sp.]|jgi:uncharacterized protein (DUF2141 family)|uniref:DUF2141 domain-containing protein n=1 Tax=uncultured Winogradskyella sp. TaxID=395353 RepID=UPI00230E0B87|nr:DUF2141 domain-containing protein [uncultured Winogradskyella sp.]MDA8768858.1 DUF2141 domain-containing protein [Winogradskyella sp.]MDG1660600.1 DUF2141 domain-containing protein [Winogradskyella sp.]